MIIRKCYLAAWFGERVVFDMCNPPRLDWPAHLRASQDYRYGASFCLILRLVNIVNVARMLRSALSISRSSNQPRYSGGLVEGTCDISGTMKECYSIQVISRLS